jgi:hypothetical protein
VPLVVGAGPITASVAVIGSSDVVMYLVHSATNEIVPRSYSQGDARTIGIDTSVQRAGQYAIVIVSRSSKPLMGELRYSFVQP